MKAIFLDKYTGETLFEMPTRGGNFYREGDTIWVAREIEEDGNVHFLVNLENEQTRKDFNALVAKHER